MKIIEQYSHLNGYESIQYHQPKLWREIVAVIGSVDASKFRTKVSKEKTMVDRLLYDPRALNKAMEEQISAQEVGGTARRLLCDPRC